MQDEYLPQMEQARHYLIDLFQGMGFTTQILKGEKHDAVYAELTTNNKLPTVLIYGHYDVQPADPLEEWKTEPFTPTVKNNVLYARGATDDKGQFMIHVMAVARLHALSEVEGSDDNSLPCNFKFLIEGEEEIGSISVESLAQKYAKNLFKCDYLLVSDSEMYTKGQPSIDISLRGLTYAEIEIRTAKQDLHSGQFGGIVQNPAIILSKVIASFKDENGKVLIEGFYDDVVDPSKEELQDYNLLEPMEKDLKKEAHVWGLGGGEKKYSLNERRWSRPTLDVNGIWSGYTGEGSKTIIPARAHAKISMRLVPNQDPEKIFTLFTQHIGRNFDFYGKSSYRLHSSALPYKSPTNHPVFDIMKKSLKKAFGKEPVFIGVGGTIGFVPVVANALNVPCLLVGFGLPDDQLHSPNEHFSLDNYYKGIETMVDFYNNLAK